jgi:hypothetical protein
MMDYLGMSLRGLATVFSFLGLSSLVGNKCKWKKEEDIIGTAIHEVSHEVMKTIWKKRLDLPWHYKRKPIIYCPQ